VEPSLNHQNIPGATDIGWSIPGSENINFVFEGLSESESSIIISEMMGRILYFAECGYATFLPNFGIIFPFDHTTTLTESKETTFTVKRVTSRTLGFEKTDELFTSHKLQFPKLLELRDLTDAVFEKIKSRLAHSIKSTNQLRKMLRRYWRNFRSCLINNGHDVTSPDIKILLGRFFASHNRQGRTEQECFAGSDVSIQSAWSKVLEESTSPIFERPVLVNSFEMASAVLGKPTYKIQIPLKQIVEQQNYDLSDIGYDLPKDVEVQSYIKRISERRFEVFFVSNGIRRCASSNEKLFGNEFIVKVPIHHQDPSVAEQLSFELANEPTDDVRLAFAYGALLSLASRTGSAPDGAAIPLEENQGSLGNGAIASFNYKTVGQLQLTEDQSFYFKSLVFLHPNEAELISIGRKSVLVHFLKKKGYDQTFDIRRPSVLHKTCVL
jgi:hypothetical protein